MTKNQIAFQAEVKRLEKIANKLLKQGFIFTEPPIPEMPKRVTQKQLRIIKSISPRQIKSKAVMPTPSELSKADNKVTTQRRKHEPLETKHRTIKAPTVVAPTKEIKPKQEQREQQEVIKPPKPSKQQSQTGKGKSQTKRVRKPRETHKSNIINQISRNIFSEATRNIQIARELLRLAVGDELAIGRETMQEMFDNALYELGETELAKRLQNIANFQENFYRSIWASNQEQEFNMYQYQIYIYEGIYNTPLTPEEYDEIRYHETDFENLREYHRNHYIDDDDDIF